MIYFHAHGSRAAQFGVVADVAAVHIMVDRKQRVTKTKGQPQPSKVHLYCFYQPLATSQVAPDSPDSDNSWRISIENLGIGGYQPFSPKLSMSVPLKGLLGKNLKEEGKGQIKQPNFIS